MTSEDRGRAQRWHDTDHGADRPKQRRSRFRTTVRKPNPQWVSSCYCCCEQCNPDFEHPRPNPYWTRARL